VTTPDDALPASAESRSLHLVEDMQFQRRTWAIERVGWGIMVLVVLFALAGVFAAGPLSTATISDQAGLVQVRYERFARVSAPSVLGIELAPGAITSSAVAIEIGHALARAIQIDRMQPTPSHERAGPDGSLMLEFEAVEPGRPTLVQIFATPNEVGFVEGTIGLRGQPAVRFTQFVYP
jgi:hypothetical protein